MKKSIAIRFSTNVILISIVVLLLIVGINSFFIKSQLLEEANTKAELVIYKSQNKINKILFQALNSSNQAKDLLQKKGITPQNIKAILTQTLKENPNIYGMAVAMQPNVLYKKPFCPYYYKKGNKIIYVDLANKNYNYLDKPWYKNVSLTRVAHWSEPYFDKGGGEILMSTYSNPIFYKNKFAGVVTIDLSLKNLTNIVSSIRILDTGYAFLLSKNHTVLVHPDKKMIMKKYPYEKHIIFNKMIKNDKEWIYYTKIENTDWILGIVLPQRELFDALYKLNIISISLVIFRILTLILTIFLISKTIIKPLKEVIQTSVDISNGNFDAYIKPPKIKDEIYQLAIAINKMQDKIKTYIENLKIATQEEEKRKSELSIANKIQMNMLPTSQNLNYEQRIKLYATLHPAKEVGGDFYDFFYLGDDKLCFIVADVSGKSVPAALFMAVAISYLRAYSSENLTPADIVNKLNNALSKNNDACMFVTLFLGILDLKNDKLSYVNAGHPTPYLFSKEKYPTPLKSINNPVIGIMPDIEFKQFDIQLEKGDKLFIYTDGVNEAFSKQQEEFGEERIKENLNLLRQTSCEEILNKMEKIIEEFRKGEPQSDDITMMLLEIKN